MLALKEYKNVIGNEDEQFQSLTITLTIQQ